MSSPLEGVRVVWGWGVLEGVSVDTSRVPIGNWFWQLQIQFREARDPKPLVMKDSGESCNPIDRRQSVGAIVCIESK